MSDPTVVAHCPFCGSGDIVGNGDQSVSCSFCNRSFIVMEQPNYPSMPGNPTATPPGHGMPGAEPPAADPAAAAPGAPQHAPVNPQTDPEALSSAPPFKMGDGKPKAEEKDDNPFAKGGVRMYRTAKGHRLNEDDFAKHVAFLVDRDYMLQDR
jgi:hypothetical protein